MRIIFVIFLSCIHIFAGWCIIHSTQKEIHGDEDRRFFKKYRLGVIYQHNNWYKFVSGPYKNLKEAKKFLHQTKKNYPTAYLRSCKKLKGADAKKIIFLHR
ncbi:SPOR domain-containing protein [Nitratiruptor sp. SB155-2]|uniref:SPOR domain-containing protein n=1 Tax=Nitratiruptor sp. (strain SB155-2) TaxID=387092 RepID=UPI00059C5653|nr:SPOR domain-containing protein [Nitratiruptor sp. SB155-2]